LQRSSGGGPIAVYLKPPRKQGEMQPDIGARRLEEIVDEEPDFSAMDSSEQIDISEFMRNSKRTRLNNDPEGLAQAFFEQEVAAIQIPTDEQYREIFHDLRMGGYHTSASDTLSRRRKPPVRVPVGKAVLQRSQTERDDIPRRGSRRGHGATESRSEVQAGIGIQIHDLRHLVDKASDNQGDIQSLRTLQNPDPRT